MTGVSAAACMVPVLAVAVALIGACAGPPRHSEPLTGPVPDSPSVRRGHVVYARFCNSCHDGGRAALGAGILPVPQALIRFQVRHGIGAMPAFPEPVIADDELDDLMTYLAAIRR